MLTLKNENVAAISPIARAQLVATEFRGYGSIFEAIPMIYAHPEGRKCSRDFPNRANGIRGYGSIFEVVILMAHY